MAPDAWHQCTGFRWQFAALTVILVTFATCQSTTDHGGSKVSECGPELTREEILRATQRATLVFSETPFEEMKPRITAAGCDYSIVLGEGLEAQEYVVIIIDRTGRVKTFPLCCDLGDCPALCTKPDR